MSELRVRVPDDAQMATYNKVEYPVRNGIAVIPDDGALRQAKGGNVLPPVSVSLSHLDLPELRCRECGRRKLALMGTTCAHCGGLCLPTPERG